MPGHYPVDERSSDLAINAWNRIIVREIISIVRVIITITS